MVARCVEGCGGAGAGAGAGCAADLERFGFTSHEEAYEHTRRSGSPYLATPLALRYLTMYENWGTPPPEAGREIVALYQGVLAYAARNGTTEGQETILKVLNVCKELRIDKIEAMEKISGTVPVVFQGEEIAVPMQVFINSRVLRDLDWEEICRGEPLHLEAPEGVSIEDFKRYIAISLNLKDFSGKFSSLDQLVEVVLLAEYFDDEDVLARLGDIASVWAGSIVEKGDTGLALRELSRIMGMSSCPSRVKQAVSTMISSLINKTLNNRGDLSLLIAQLLSLEPRDWLGAEGIELDLTEAGKLVTNDVLVELSSSLRVKKLTLCSSPATVLPPALAANLESLKISLMEEIVSIPAMPLLKILDVDNCTKLADVTALNNSRCLEEIKISGAAIETLPSGCAALKKVRVQACPRLIHLDALNGLMSLRELSICELAALIRVPTGCASLSVFSASNCGVLADLDPLNGSRSLTHLELYNLAALSRVPNRCASLQSVGIHGCSSLVDLDPLNGSPKLTRLKVHFMSALTRIPTGCEALEDFEASYCNSLTDIEPIRASKRLKSIQVHVHHHLNRISIFDVSWLRTQPMLARVDFSSFFDVEDPLQKLFLAASSSNKGMICSVAKLFKELDEGTQEVLLQAMYRAKRITGNASEAIDPWSDIGRLAIHRFFLLGEKSFRV